jgi:sterol desaturase/sphingolipid hydroxylase (fatty acid hydroxylase superfamily)
MSFSPLDWFGEAQQALFERLLQPLMFHAGLGNLLEDGYRATGWLLVGLLQIGVMLTLMRALERWRPVEPVSDRAAVRTDIVYTLVHRLGLFRVLMFFSIDPLWDLLAGELRLLGFSGVQLDALWPGVTDHALLSFCLYLLVFDFADYGYHRAQHRVGWWWQLHALHHSQRQMTLWTDNRNHLLDDLLRDSLFVLLALLIGVPPGQFVALVAVTQLVESLSHANVRMDFGPVIGRLLVSPRYHRLHHAIGLGHEADLKPGTLGGHNFAVLFPVWDILFGTARYDGQDHPTGIRDQLPEEGGRDYGSGFWRQQWLGLKRLLHRA